MHPESRLGRFAMLAGCVALGLGLGAWGSPATERKPGLTRKGDVVWSVQAPRIRYPSDAFPTPDGKHVVFRDWRAAAAR